MKEIWVSKSDARMKNRYEEQKETSTALKGNSSLYLIIRSCIGRPNTYDHDPNAWWGVWRGKLDMLTTMIDGI